jgi:hypothetical protein
MARTAEVHVLLDRGTPESPVVAVFTDYRAAEARAAELNAANGSSDFVVSSHTPVRS